MKQKNTTTEGLLAIFLGVFGAHYFYRGKIGLGILRIILGWAGPLFLASPLPALMSDGLWGSAFGLMFMFSLLGPILAFAPAISAIAGIIEGIAILTNGNPKNERDSGATDAFLPNDNIQQNQSGKRTTNIQNIYPTPKDTKLSDDEIKVKKSDSNK